MPEENEEILHPEWEEEEEDGGGPVKSFLEHLEDLRWVLIKSGAAIIIGMVVCLLASNRLVALLEHPLERARQLHLKPKQTLVVWFGSKPIAEFDLKNLKDLPGVPLLTNTPKQSAYHFRLVPTPSGTNWILTLQPLKNPPAKYISKAQPQLIFLTPAAPFLTSIKLAFFGGLVLSFPFVLYFVGEFVVPALKRKEKKYLSRALGIGIGLFLLGALFCYFVMIPVALRAAVAYSGWLNVPVQNWMADSYFSLVVIFMGAMGVAFEFPVILLVLVKLGVINYQQLASFRKYLIVICLTIGAMLTPPDVVTQILMAVPLIVLFEIAYWIARFWEWRDRRRAKKAAPSTNR